MGMAAVMRGMKVTAVDTAHMRGTKVIKGMVLTVVMALMADMVDTALMADTAHTELTQWKAPLRRCFFVGISIVKNYI